MSKYIVVIISFFTITFYLFLLTYTILLKYKNNFTSIKIQSKNVN